MDTELQEIIIRELNQYIKANISDIKFSINGVVQPQGRIKSCKIIDYSINPNMAPNFISELIAMDYSIKSSYEIEINDGNGIFTSYGTHGQPQLTVDIKTQVGLNHEEKINGSSREPDKYIVKLLEIIDNTIKIINYSTPIF